MVGVGNGETRVPRLLIIVALVSIGLFSGAIGFALVANKASLARQDTAQRAACEADNEIRRILQNQLREQNEQSRRTSPKLFPDIPPDKFRRLIAEAIARRQASIREAHPIDCEKVVTAARAERR